MDGSRYGIRQVEKRTRRLGGAMTLAASQSFAPQETLLRDSTNLNRLSGGATTRFAALLRAFNRLHRQFVEVFIQVLAQHDVSGDACAGSSNSGQRAVAS